MKRDGKAWQEYRPPEMSIAGMHAAAERLRVASRAAADAGDRLAAIDLERAAASMLAEAQRRMEAA